YGVRWEVNPAPTGLNHPLYTLTGFPDLAALYLAAPGTPLYPTRWAKLAPRAGAAYRLRQAGSQVTLARGSFGFFYDLGAGATATAARMFPYNRSVRRTNVTFPPDDARSAEAAPLRLQAPCLHTHFTSFALVRPCRGSRGGGGPVEPRGAVSESGLHDRRSREHAAPDMGVVGEPRAVVLGRPASHGNVCRPR